MNEYVEFLFFSFFLSIALSHSLSFSLSRNPTAIRTHVFLLWGEEGWRKKGGFMFTG